MQQRKETSEATQQWSRGEALNKERSTGIYPLQDFKISSDRNSGDVQQNPRDFLFRKEVKECKMVIDIPSETPPRHMASV